MIIVRINRYIVECKLEIEDYNTKTARELIDT